MEWTSEGARDRFGELLDRVDDDGPQVIIRDGKRYRVVRASAPKTGTAASEFIDYLMSGPGLEDVDLSRDQSPMRDIEW